MATATEPPLPAEDEGGDDGFIPGMCVGIGVAALVVHIAMTSMGDLEGLYRDIGKVMLPLLTRITISVAWKIGVPLVGFVVLGTLIVRRPKSRSLYVAAAIACVVAAAMTFWYPSAPIHELANTIRE